MANTFKNASLADVTTNGISASHSGGLLYTCPSATTAIILGLALTNKTDASVTISAQFTDTSASGNRLLLNEVSIPANTTLEVLAGQKYVLETGDILRCQAGTGSAIDAVLGLMQID
tara:strand:+ start:1325 stop:1675 length:351 start_codon:yes stop_codon:yes gene_type:complete